LLLDWSQLLLLSPVHRYILLLARSCRQLVCQPTVRLECGKTDTLVHIVLVHNVSIDHFGQSISADVRAGVRLNCVIKPCMLFNRNKFHVTKTQQSISISLQAKGRNVKENDPVGQIPLNSESLDGRGWRCSSHHFLHFLHGDNSLVPGQQVQASVRHHLGELGNFHTANLNKDGSRSVRLNSSTSP